jgi:hypothetical protein
MRARPELRAAATATGPHLCDKCARAPGRPTIIVQVDARQSPRRRRRPSDEHDDESSWWAATRVSKRATDGDCCRGGRLVFVAVVVVVVAAAVVVGAGGIRVVVVVAVVGSMRRRRRHETWIINHLVAGLACEAAACLRARRVAEIARRLNPGARTSWVLQFVARAAVLVRVRPRAAPAQTGRLGVGGGAAAARASAGRTLRRGRHSLCSR